MPIVTSHDSHDFSFTLNISMFFFLITRFSFRFLYVYLHLLSIKQSTNFIEALFYKTSNRSICRNDKIRKIIHLSHVNTIAGAL